jgi:hypothetical protein
MIGDIVNAVLTCESPKFRCATHGMTSDTLSFHFNNGDKSPRFCLHCITALLKSSGAQTMETGQ